MKGITEMKSFYLYLKFAVYMIGTMFTKAKYEKLKKRGMKKEAEEYLANEVKRWANFTIKSAGVTVTVKGVENIPKEPCLFVSNHQGMMDIPVILSELDRPIGFIAKKEILKYKSISYWMKEIHCVFMDRSNVRESVKSINEGVQYLKEGFSMCIFPEGTRSKGPEVGEFKKGSMKLGLKAGVPIVPLSIDGTYKVREANGGKIKAAHVNLIIGKPIISESLDKEQQQNLSEEIRGIIKSTLENNR